MSIELKDFRAKFSPSREGYDFSILDNLTESEKAEIETLLIPELTPDTTDLIQALGYLRSQEAFTPLVNLLPQTKGVAKVHVAQALWRINQYEPSVEILCKILTERKLFGFKNKTYERWHAAKALGEVDDDRAVAALKVSFNDKDALVQNHSRRSLIILLGIKDQYEAIEEKYKEKDNGRVVTTAAGRQKTREEQEKLLEEALDNYDQQGL